MDVWTWITELTTESSSFNSSQLVFELAKSEPGKAKPARSMQLKASRTASQSDSLIFSLYLQGFESLKSQKNNPLWVSNPCSLSSEKPFLPLLLQLLQEIIDRSPTGANATCPISQLPKLKPDPVSWIMDSHSLESLSSFFDLVLLTRLFWLCVCEAPTEVGSFYFNSLLGPNLLAVTSNHAPVLPTFLLTVGVDAELCFMRTIGYMLAKWLILKDIVGGGGGGGGAGLQTLVSMQASDHEQFGFSYATEAHGLWVLKGYAPVSGMMVTTRYAKSRKFRVVMDAKERAMRYAWAHHQLEAVIQLEYTVTFHDQAGYIQVNARVDNLRFQVVKLGFNKDDEDEKKEEEEDYPVELKHFVSKIRVWVGPEVGATYVSGVSLGRSTAEEECELEKEMRSVKSRCGKTQAVKMGARVVAKTKPKRWRWEQEAEGNAAVFSATLCQDQEIGAGGGGRRVVFAGDEYGEGVGWRMSREMEGSVFKWRVGGQASLTYLSTPPYSETKSVYWSHEVDLPLIKTLSS